MRLQSVAVIGAGAWGTALAMTLQRAGRDVTLWARRPELAAAINASRVNAAYLPGVALNPAIVVTAEVSALAAADFVLLVTPAQHFRAIATQLRPHLPPGAPVIACAKGLEQSSGKLPVGILTDILPATPLAVLSGPSFASEVARGLPTAITLAAADASLGEALAQAIGHTAFRPYWTDDVTGVQLGGAVKNVLAIAAGIVDGLGLGANAHAAVVTRGFAELQRFGAALGGRPATLLGLSGLGDLILTCGSPQSRNLALGRALGQGQSLTAAMAGLNGIAEGVPTAAAVQRFAVGRSIDLPVCTAVYAVLKGGWSVADAAHALQRRPFRPET